MKPVIVGSVICTVLFIIFVCGIVILIILDHQATLAAIRAARQKCDEYTKLACSHPILSDDSSERNLSDVQRGTNAPEGMLPHMVYLEMTASKGTGHCGGTLISEYFVMTAAHCVEHIKPQNVNVKLGTVDSRLGSWYQVQEVIVHTDFVGANPGTYYSDIALLRLKTKVQFDWKKRPICLNTNLSSIDEKTLTASGWGITEYGVLSPILQVVDQKLDEEVKKMCRRINGWLADLMICVSPPARRTGVCQGDSGGPLQVPLKNNGTCANIYEQVGITSIGDPEACNHTLPWKNEHWVMYTKVEAYIYWIVSHVWPEML